MMVWKDRYTQRDRQRELVIVIFANPLEVSHESILHLKMSPYYWPSDRKGPPCEVLQGATHIPS